MIIVIKYDNYNKTRFYLFVSSRGEVSSIGLNVFKIEPCDLVSTTIMNVFKLKI